MNSRHPGQLGFSGNPYWRGEISFRSPQEVISMRKVLLVLAVCILGLTLAFGQTSSSPSAAQQSPSAQSSQSQPSSQPAQGQQGQATPKSGDTSVSGSASGSASGSPSGQTGASSPSNSRQANSNDQTQEPSRANNRGGGLPWGWIILGIIAVVVLIALATRGSGTDRVERVDRVERHDDDIRRVG
jgi:cobalamin biosynthesis Mg chelatase CobN